MHALNAGRVRLNFPTLATRFGPLPTPHLPTCSPGASIARSRSVGNALWRAEAEDEGFDLGGLGSDGGLLVFGLVLVMIRWCVFWGEVF